MSWLKKISQKLRLLPDALKKFNDDNGFFLSSGITFNLLIGLIPLSLLLLAVLGTYLYSDQAVLSHLSDHLEDMVPSLDPDRAIRPSEVTATELTPSE